MPGFGSSPAESPANQLSIVSSDCSLGVSSASISSPAGVSVGGATPAFALETGSMVWVAVFLAGTTCTSVDQKNLAV